MDLDSLILYQKVYLFVTIVVAIVQIIMIVKFFQIAMDVRAMKRKQEKPDLDFNTEFYKWIACRNIEKAKELLTNKIGESEEFARLLRGGNAKYMEEVKNKLMTKYKKELDLVNLELDLSNWQ